MIHHPHISCHHIDYIISSWMLQDSLSQHPVPLSLIPYHPCSVMRVILISTKHRSEQTTSQIRSGHGFLLPLGQSPRSIFLSSVKLFPLSRSTQPWLHPLLRLQPWLKCEVIPNVKGQVRCPLRPSLSESILMKSITPSSALLKHNAIKTVTISY